MTVKIPKRSGTGAGRGAQESMGHRCPSHGWPVLTWSVKRSGGESDPRHAEFTVGRPGK